MIKQIEFYFKISGNFVNIIEKSYNERNFDGIYHEKFKKFLDSTLEEYLAKIVLNIGDYKCFMQLYKLLNGDSYNAPFVLNYTKNVDFL